MPPCSSGLAGLENPVFLIDPVDLPFGFEMTLDAASPRPAGGADSVGGSCVPGPPAAIIRGPLVALIALLEGQN